MLVTACLKKSDLVGRDGYPNQYTVRYQTGRLSVQPDGSLAVRPLDTEIGEWEQGTLIDNKLVWTSTPYPTGAYAMLVVDL